MHSLLVCQDISNVIKLCVVILDEDKGGDVYDDSFESKATFNLEAISQTLDEDCDLTDKNNKRD